MKTGNEVLCGQAATSIMKIEQSPMIDLSLFLSHTVFSFAWEVTIEGFLQGFLIFTLWVLQSSFTEL